MDDSRTKLDATKDAALPPSDAAQVREHFQQTLASQRKHAEELKRKRLNFAVFRFLSTWLFFLGILVVIALLSNLEWARPKIEESMSESFHRQVKLGNLSWVLGLNGLAISTNKLEMIEKDGKPFIISGPSEIGVAFLPLFQKRVLVKHVDFHRPEVFATQLAPGKWNFTDLLVEGPEIRFVQVDKGRLHLRNRITQEQLAQPHPNSVFANTNWSAYDFENVNVKLIFPRKDQKRSWPFYLAFQLPRELGGQKYTTDFSLTILGQGQFEQWRQKKCNIEIRAENVNPSDWRPFMHLPDGLNGLMSFNFKGEGVLDKAVNGDITYSARDISVVHAERSLFSAEKVEGAGKASFGSGAFKWDKSTIVIGGVKLESHGEVFDWQSAAPRYDARISADLRNLSQLSDTSLWRFFPGAKKEKDLSGSAIVEVSFEGEGNRHKVFTSLKAENIPLANLLSNGGTSNGAPLLSLFQIEPNAPIHGQIEIGHDQRILLKDVQIPAKGSKLKIEGFIDAHKQEHDIRLQAEKLALDKFDTMELAAKPASAKPAPGGLALTGKVNFDAHLTASKGSNVMDVKAKLDHASLSGPSGVLAQDMSGNFRFDGSTITFDDIKGVLANGGVHGGSLKFNGKLQTGKNGTCDLEVSGHQIDIEQLIGFARAAHLPLPANAVDDIKGLARDLDIQIKGKAAAPELTLNLSPADIRYAFKVPNGIKEIHATNGNVTLADGMLQLRSVSVSSEAQPRGSKLVVNASFEQKSNGIVPKLLHLRANSVDIAEFAQLAQSDTLPADVRKKLHAMFTPLHLKEVEGKAYGDITIRMAEKGNHFVEGLVGLTNVSGNFGEQGLPFERFGGLLSFSGDDVVLQDMTVSSGGAHLTFTGEVKSFQKAPAWSIQLGGRARGQDLVAFIPAQVSKVEMHSNAPLTVRGNFNGDGKTVHGVFIVTAASGDHFKLKTDAVAIQQAPNHAMSLDGTVAYSSKENTRALDLRSWHITLGESVIQGSAHFGWTTDASKKPTVDLIVSTPNPVPADIMVGAFLPGIDGTGSSGTLKGTFAAAGEVGDLLTHGELTLSKVTVPALKMKDVEGKIDLPRWAISSAARQDKIASEARLFISQGNIGNVDTRDAHATLKLESGSEKRITLRDGAATVSGGRMNLNVFYVPDSGKWKLDLGFEKMAVDQFVTDLIDHSGELTGLADGKITLASTADGDVISNLDGSGNVVIYKGSAPRLGQLHEKLQVGNLIQQGIFGFNFNNVLHSMVPTKTGKFREITMDFIVNKGVVDIDRLNFDGSDLRLRAAGDWHIVGDRLNLEVAGDIPRVASSVLPGAVGEVTRNFTLQKAVSVVTFRKLGNLPNLPIIGDIGTDDPRAFTFKIAANLDSPDAVSKSIEKSFKWLPNKPNASAHPVPGLN
jgi:hypothetical protein